MAEHNLLGREGERIAKSYLQENGYQILAENWRHSKAEVDLIGSKDGIVIFAEVKTRSSAKYGEPDDFVLETKMNHLAYAAEEYIELMDHRGEVRFDIISILFEDKEKYTLTHIDDAFWPE